MFDARLLLLMFSFNIGIALADEGYVKMYNYGNRLVVFVAFDANYTFSNFMTNLRQFAYAFQCPYRHQFITFYFGDLSMKIDCDYGMNLVECVDARFVDNDTTGDERI